MKVTIISPNPPGSGCGVGDYSYQLHQILASQSKIESQAGRSIAFFFAIMREALTRRNTVIILNYSAWGYQYLGLPFHLALFYQVAAWRRKRVITVFHELWASTYQKRTKLHSRIIDWLQRYLICKLASRSSVIVTSTQEKRKFLGQCCVEKDILLVPVPSNIRKVSERSPSPLNDKFRLVVFGREATRMTAVRCVQSFVEDLSTNGSLEAIEFIGEGSDLDAKYLAELGINPEKIIKHKYLDSKDVSSRLNEADFLLSPYLQSDVGKSGTIQAALLHRVIPIGPGSGKKFEVLGCPGVRLSANGLERERVEEIRNSLPSSISMQQYAELFNSFIVGSNK